MNHKHIVRSYEEELSLLKAKVLEMGGLAQKQLRKSVETLITRDSEMAQAVVAADIHINQLQKSIDQLTLAMLARRQPMALDLRNIVSGLKMASDLERIADYSRNIARHSMDLNSADVEQPTQAIIRMAECAEGMLADAMTAYEETNAELTRKVWHQDDIIDREYAALLSDLRRFMNEESEYAKPFTALLLVARCCERIGDHIQNIAEAVHFIVTGETYHGD